MDLDQSANSNDNIFDQLKIAYNMDDTEINWLKSFLASCLKSEIQPFHIIMAGERNTGRTNLKELFDNVLNPKSDQDLNSNDKKTKLSCPNSNSSNKKAKLS